MGKIFKGKPGHRGYRDKNIQEVRKVFLCCLTACPNSETLKYFVIRFPCQISMRITITSVLRQIITYGNQLLRAFFDFSLYNSTGMHQIQSRDENFCLAELSKILFIFKNIER